MTVWKNLPNALSVMRIIAVPFFVYFLAIDRSVIGARIALGIYFAASLTDIFDGRIARRYHLESKLGGLLDASADKLFVVAGFICPLARGVLPWWLVVLTLVREVYVFWMGLQAIKKHVQPVPTRIGKIRTVFQMATVVAILIFMAISDNLSWDGLWLMDDNEATPLTALVSSIAWIGLILSLYSALQYTKIYIVKNRELKEAERMKGTC